jgi:hypothetical protein
MCSVQPPLIFFTLEAFFLRCIRPVHREMAAREIAGIEEYGFADASEWVHANKGKNLGSS